MALRYVARSVGVPALRRASVPRVSLSAGPQPLAYHSRQLGYRLGAMIVNSRKLESHMEKELGRLFWGGKLQTCMGKRSSKKYWLHSKLCLNLQESLPGMHEEWRNSTGGV